MQGIRAAGRFGECPSRVQLGAFYARELHDRLLVSTYNAAGNYPELIQSSTLYPVRYVDIVYRGPAIVYPRKIIWLLRTFAARTSDLPCLWNISIDDG